MTLTAEQTREHAEVIRQRQATCWHAFARGIVDHAAQWTHCGLPESSYVAPVGFGPGYYFP